MRYTLEDTKESFVVVNSDGVSVSVTRYMLPEDNPAAFRKLEKPAAEKIAQKIVDALNQS